MSNMKAALAVVAVEEWNAANPIGTSVLVLRDDGTDYATKTRSEAWVICGDTAVVKLEGISGGYLLSRVRRKPDPSLNAAANMGWPVP